MISYVMVGTNDLERSHRYFIPLLAAMGFEQAYQTKTQIGWQHPIGNCKFVVTLPFDGLQAQSGNGSMISFQVQTKAIVDDVYRKAIETGGMSEGAPGMRGRNFYGSYFRDLDGNKFCVHSLVESE